MISAVSGTNVQNQTLCFSAIARSVMISADDTVVGGCAGNGFSAIARSVMISASN